MNINCTLKDCGFTKEFAEQYLEAVATDNLNRQIKVLETQRKLMLDEMHVAAKKLDCIDFLICECKKKMKQDIR